MMYIHHAYAPFHCSLLSLQLTAPSLPFSEIMVTKAEQFLPLNYIWNELVFNFQFTNTRKGQKVETKNSMMVHTKYIHKVLE